MTLYPSSTSKPPNTNFQSPRRRELTWNFWGGQFIQISAPELLKMELTLWEDISNMLWVQKLLMRRLLLCNSTTNWKTNSSPRPRILENRCCTDGGIIISKISPLFSAASFLKISLTCSEPRIRQYGVALYPTVLPNSQVSALSVTVSSRTDFVLFAKNGPNFRFWWAQNWAHFVRRYLKHAVLSSCYCSACFYAILLPTGKITAL